MTSVRLADLLECDPLTTTVVGVEREYRVLDARRQPIDFRTVISSLSLPGAGLNPSDPNAHHLPSGELLTADGPEAEAAIPPIALSPGFTWQVTSWAEHAEDVLIAALPAGTAIEGFSTHLNVSVGADVVPVADLFAKHFAVGMMLLLDLVDSPGLLVRPRPGRLELGGDFVEGEQLRAALTYAAAAARRCAAVVQGRSDAAAALPIPVPARLERAKDRPGWFIAPDTYAPGFDLATQGRDELARAWRSVRRELSGLASPSELDVVDEMVNDGAGRRPIPREQLCGPDRSDTERQSVFANLHPRERGDLHVRVAAVSWTAVAFAIGSTEGEFHVIVPRRWLRSFLERLDTGALDEALPRANPGNSDREPTVVRGSFDPRMVVPPEPNLRRSWLHQRRPELVGAAVSGALVVAAHHFWP